MARPHKRQENDAARWACHGCLPCLLSRMRDCLRKATWTPKPPCVVVVVCKELALQTSSAPRKAARASVERGPPSPATLVRSLCCQVQLRLPENQPHGPGPMVLCLRGPETSQVRTPALATSSRICSQTPSMFPKGAPLLGTVWRSAPLSPLEPTGAAPGSGLKSEASAIRKLVSIRADPGDLSIDLFEKGDADSSRSAGDPQRRLLSAREGHRAFAQIRAPRAHVGTKFPRAALRPTTNSDRPTSRSRARRASVQALPRAPPDIDEVNPARVNPATSIVAAKRSRKCTDHALRHARARCARRSRCPEGPHRREIQHIRLLLLTSGCSRAALRPTSSRDRPTSRS